MGGIQRICAHSTEQDKEHLRRQTQVLRARYDRLALLYDWVLTRGSPGSPGNGKNRNSNRQDKRQCDAPWRRLLCRSAAGQVLELGAGTGANFPYYKPDVELTAVDVSPRMLSLARRRAGHLVGPARFEVADAQMLPFPAGTFDCVVSSFFFCTVPSPQAALAEVMRVLRPGGQLLLLEHERSHHPLLGLLLDAIAPVARLLVGDHPNRHTRQEVVRAGFTIEQEIPLWLDVVYFIRARRP